MSRPLAFHPLHLPGSGMFTPAPTLLWKPLDCFCYTSSMARAKEPLKAAACSLLSTVFIKWGSRLFPPLL